MSVFSDTHGHTTAVDFTVSNHEPLYKAFMAIVDKVTAEPDRSRQGDQPESLETAAAEYRRMVSGLSRSQYGDLRGVDLNRVDWFGLIRDELAERERFARNEAATVPATLDNMRAFAGRPGLVMYCPETGEEFSADAGDYWHMPRGEVLTGEDGSPAYLAIKVPASVRLITEADR